MPETHVSFSDRGNNDAGGLPALAPSVAPADHFFPLLRITLICLFNRFAHSAGPGMVRQRVEVDGQRRRWPDAHIEVTGAKCGLRQQQRERVVE